jgi:hypothetical protein
MNEEDKSKQSLAFNRLDHAQTVQLPLDQIVLSEANKLISEDKGKTDQFYLCASQDPVLILELFNKAKESSKAGEKTFFSSIGAVMSRIGENEALQFLNQLNSRNANTIKWVEIHRSKGKRSGLIARMIAQITAKNLADEAQLSALLHCIGEMLAASVLESEYAELAELTTRAGVLHSLVNDFNFDVNQIERFYLSKRGIPSSLIVAIRPAPGAPETEPLKTIRSIVMSAKEMVERFDEGTWDKIAPGEKLPMRSALQNLSFTNSANYTKLYERASEYLTKIKFIESQRREKTQAHQSYPEVAQDTSNDDNVISSEIITTVTNTTPTYKASRTPLKQVLKETPLENSIEDEPQKLQSVQEENTESNNLKEKDSDRKNTNLLPEKAVFEQNVKHSPKKRKSEKFIDQSGKNRTKKRPLHSDDSESSDSDVKLTSPTPLIALKGTKKILTSMNRAMSSAKNSEELLSNLLSTLIDDGPFEKTAIIVISEDRKNATVVAARGPNIGNGQRLSLDDPLSPLAQSISKIQSFGRKESSVSPFGSKAFAVAPLDTHHHTPVALYADCGSDNAITFEARRIFRSVVDMVNEKIRDLPGGIPYEI